MPQASPMNWNFVVNLLISILINFSMKNFFCPMNKSSMDPKNNNFNKISWKF